MTSINRGDVWWVNFNTPLGGEIQKTRPSVIISNDYANKLLNRIQVIPITSKASKCYPCEALVLIDKKKAKAMADQLTTISKKRLITKIGSLTNSEMLKINNAIKLQLSL